MTEDATAPDRVSEPGRRLLDADTERRQRALEAMQERLRPALEAQDEVLDRASIADEHRSS